MMREGLSNFALKELHERHRPGLEILQSRPEVRTRIGRIVDVRGSAGSGILAIETEGEFAGIAGLVRSSAYDGTDVELVCALLQEYEGRGLATAACRQILAEETRLARRLRVLASIAPDNSDARLLAQRLGFERVGTRVNNPDELWAVAV